MRQDVLTRWSVSSNRQCVGLLPVCLVVFSAGCQLTSPLTAPGSGPQRVASVPNHLGQGVSSSYKPPAVGGSGSVGQSVDRPSSPALPARRDAVDQVTTGQVTTGQGTTGQGTASQNAAASARIRGQSPGTWQTGTLGGSDTSRGPMAATDTTVGGNNRYAAPSGKPTSLPAVPST
ncbi:MAG: hypothetical protein KDA45_14170, partial [Planctomycetales bacterium]|nr:hypothetical protein [Planctomycetales bacterium]